MSIFKTRESKKRPSRHQLQQNLSSLHQKKIEDFRKNAERCKAIEAKLQSIVEEVTDIKKLPLKELVDLRRLVDLQESRDELTHELGRLKGCEEMMNYYYSTNDIINKYNSLEDDPSSNKIMITDFFREYSGEIGGDSLKKEAWSKGPTNKKELLDMYLEVVDPCYSKDSGLDQFSFCLECQEEMILKKEVGTYICTYCGQTNSVLVDGESNKVNNIDGQKYSVYQRKNHFREWLNQIQAKESTEIPQDVFDRIIVELNKMQFHNLAELNPAIIRSILKKLNLSKYYENTFHIIYRLNGLQPPTLARDIEEQLLKYFKIGRAHV